MNLRQKHYALLKLAQVKKAMRFVLTKRAMKKQAADIDHDPSLKKTGPGGTKRKDPPLPKTGKPLDMGFMQAPIDVRNYPLLSVGAEPIVPDSTVNILSNLMGAAPNKDNIRIEPPRIPTSTGRLTGSNARFNLGPTADEMRANPLEYDLSPSTPSKLPHFLPQRKVQDPRTGETSRVFQDEDGDLKPDRYLDVPSIVDEREFNITDPRLKGSFPAWQSPFIEQTARDAVRRQAWQDIHNEAVAEAKRYYETNGIPVGKIDDKDYRMRVARIIDRLASERMGVPLTPQDRLKPYSPYDARWRDRF